MVDDGGLAAIILATIIIISTVTSVIVRQDVTDEIDKSGITILFNKAYECREIKNGTNSNKE